MIGNTNSSGQRPLSYNDINNIIAEGLPYLTTAPTADNPNANEKIILVVLPESQRATTIQYVGYWYIFVQYPPTP